uniref:Ig-like domain-containing protein n=1 Tax=Anopheles culicifacies TaxID=139723 RepID=A0A182MCL2_9DIPT
MTRVVARKAHRKCKCNTMNANLPLIAAVINFVVICLADTLSPEMQMYWENHMVQPYFDNTTKREVTAIAGQTCQLHCRVKSLGDRAVSWIRKRDLHILTVGILTYTNDQRFQSLHTDGSDEWTLRITSPQARDSGVYECQVSTEPKISQAFRVNVVVSKANILGNSELFVKSGSDINLTCEALQSPLPPSFIYWYKGGRVINYSQRGGISVLTEQQTRTSRLVISRASPSDSGNYTCAPSNSAARSLCKDLSMMSAFKTTPKIDCTDQVGRGVATWPIVKITKRAIQLNPVRQFIALLALYFMPSTSPAPPQTIAADEDGTL